MSITSAKSFPLSPMQQGMLFHHLSEGRPGVDLEQIVFRLEEDLDLERFERAWELAAGRHAALRTSFRWDGVPEPVQEVSERAALRAHFEDWRGASDEQVTTRLESFLREDRERGFDLTSAPVARLSLFRTAEHAYAGVWSFHHLLMDGRSFALVLGDVFDAYGELSRGGSPAVTPTPSFEDHVAWLRRRGAPPEDREYWRQYLDGFQDPTPLPLSGPAPAGEVDGAPRGEHTVRLSRASTDRLRELAGDAQVTLNTLLQGAWALLLSRHTGARDVVFGATRACRHSGAAGTQDVAGVFINTLPVRVDVDPEQRLTDWLRELRRAQVSVRDHEHTALVEVQACSAIPVGTPLFESLIVYDNQTLDSVLKARGGAWERREFVLRERTSFPLTLYGYGESELTLQLSYDRERLTDWSMERLAERLRAALERMPADPGVKLGDLSVLPQEELAELLEGWNATRTEAPRGVDLADQFEAQAARTPEAIAVHQGSRSVRYGELDHAANRLARRLRDLGVVRGSLVGVATGRTIEMVTALLAIHKAGAAYLPLDPDFPAERLAFMVEDSGVRVILTDAAHAESLPAGDAARVLVDDPTQAGDAGPADPLERERAPGDLAYVIYTSGSTGRPKGVQVEHRNVVNFFAGMDERIGTGPGTWLAVTSLSFDISVLELYWTLTRGFEVVLYSADDRQAALPAPAPAVGAAGGAAATSFSLFYFASDEDEGTGSKYELVLEGARFADRHGFEAVWTPERHFHRFGGLYPNPAVMSAALASITERVHLRSGSVVLPLHHPARIAEEWALVDNLSKGRVGISVASGWHPNDFVLAPDNYADRKGVMERGIETLRALWRGEAIEFPGPDGAPVSIQTLPRPIQPELPVWVTAAGNPETFRIAGRTGTNVLTHLLGQSVQELAQKVAVYREAWREAGHPGNGHVTVMLHSFVGEDFEAVKELVRGPMKSYLRSAMDLIRKHVTAWSAVRTELQEEGEGEELSLESLSEEDRESLLEFSFERYLGTSSLLGTVETCLPIVRSMQDMGVDELACLIDFGVARDKVLEHLPKLEELRRAASVRATAEASPETVGTLLERHGVDHMQSTPSMARLMLADEKSRAALAGLRRLMIGGEAFPPSLAQQLAAATDAEILNMYGPTETTIWSTTHRVDPSDPAVPIGRPIANTRLYVLDGRQGLVPTGVPGELYIGGDGVVRGYLGRPELTAERFVTDPFGGPGDRLYRTGDVVRYRADGVLDFLGRTDHQVKVRGYRIELGEIERVLEEQSGVSSSAVLAREDVPGDVRLVAYFVAQAGEEPDAAALRAGLAARLPDYMLPARFVRLDELPLTPNKKIDRKRLPRPDEVAEVREQPKASPATHLESEIAALWAQLLGLTEVGREDNFFDLGGHSLLVVQMHGRLKALSPRPIGVTDLFRFPTVRSLAAFLSESAAEEAAPASRSEDDVRKGQARRESLRQRRQQARSRRPGTA